MTARPLLPVFPASLMFMIIFSALAGACSSGGGGSPGDDERAGSADSHGEFIRVDDARLHIVPGGASGAAYMNIVHEGSGEDRLVRVEMEGVQSVQIHESIQGEDGVMRMRAAPNGFALPAHSVLELKRGGKHVMLLGISEPPEVGENVEMTLHFERAGAVTIEVPVKEYGD